LLFLRIGASLLFLSKTVGLLMRQKSPGGFERIVLCYRMCAFLYCVRLDLSSSRAAAWILRGSGAPTPVSALKPVLFTNKRSAAWPKLQTRLDLRLH
jgi:hypothetical protein